MPLLRLPPVIPGITVPAPVPRPDGRSITQMAVCSPTSHPFWRWRYSSAKTFVITGRAALRMVQRDGTAVSIPMTTRFSSSVAARQHDGVVAQRAGPVAAPSPPVRLEVGGAAHALILQTCDRPTAPHAVGMQRGKVPGVRSAVARTAISAISVRRDFTDHHHIRVRTQNCAQRQLQAYRHAYVGATWRLTDPFNQRISIGSEP